MTEQPFFQAFERLQQDLQSNGIDEQMTAYILGTLSARVVEQVAIDVVTAVGQDKASQITPENAEEIVNQLKEEFEKKEGISIEDYREKIAEQLVQEYESLETAPPATDAPTEPATDSEA